ncbi:MAG: hypothetical protein R2774_09145 [Saprospiraceae bacterium]
MKQNIKHTLSIVIILFSTNLFSQQNIQLNASHSVEKLMEDFVEHGKSEETIKAWRIQIITTDDRRAMEQAMSTFSGLYPGVAMDWKHIAPYYQVRVGYYETKNKMMPFLLEVRKTFNSATPVFDQVNKTTIVRS